MAGEKDIRNAGADEGVPDAPGVPGAHGKGAAPDDAKSSQRDEGEGLPEHRSMGQRSDLGEGDLKASDYADEMSRSPSRS